jgi:starvation-inducible DNA-binding protein
VGLKSHKTRNDLKSNAKAVSIDILNGRLAKAIDLALVYCGPVLRHPAALV